MSMCVDMTRHNDLTRQIYKVICLGIVNTLFDISDFSVLKPNIEDAIDSVRRVDYMAASEHKIVSARH